MPVTPTAMITVNVNHPTGTAIAPPTGTVHFRFVRAPQATMTAPIAARSQTGTGSTGRLTAVSRFLSRTSAHWNHSPGASTNDTAAIAAVAPRAIASERHSRRTTNQTNPTPGDTFDSRTNAHAAGQRNPATIAAPMRISTLPRAMDAITG